MSKLTIEDIRNPSRKSGFNHVGYRSDTGVVRKSPWSAIDGRCIPGTRTRIWTGPRRETPKQAAQDYCDYINSGKAPAPKPKAPKVPKRSTLYLKGAGHARPKDNSVTTVKPKKATKPERGEGRKQGVVYLVGEKGNDSEVKIGWSKHSAYSRLPGLQTGNPRMLVGLAERSGTLSDEYSLHLQFEPDNVLQEWFTVSKELLSEFDLDVKEFKELVA